MRMTIKTEKIVERRLAVAFKDFGVRRLGVAFKRKKLRSTFKVIRASKVSNNRYKTDNLLYNALLARIIFVRYSRRGW